MFYHITQLPFFCVNFMWSVHSDTSFMSLHSRVVRRACWAVICRANQRSAILYKKKTCCIILQHRETQHSSVNLTLRKQLFLCVIAVTVPELWYCNEDQCRELHIVWTGLEDSYILQCSVYLWVVSHIQLELFWKAEEFSLLFQVAFSGLMKRGHY